MSRSRLVLRDAVAHDAPFLAVLWAEALRRAEPEEQAHDVADLLDDVADDPDRRVVVACRDDEPVGAVLLCRGTATPLDRERVVRMVAPSVLPGARRHGVGQALVECAVALAEEEGIGLVAASAVAGSREANRFMARLGLSPRSTYRTAPTALVRSRLGATRPDRPRTVADARRPVDRVLARRRSQRRRDAVLPEPGVVGPPLS